MRKKIKPQKNRLFPSKFDKAIHTEKPLVYSRDKLIKIITADLGYPTKFIVNFVDTEIKAKFKLI